MPSPYPLPLPHQNKGEREGEGVKRLPGLYPLALETKQVGSVEMHGKHALLKAFKVWLPTAERISALTNPYMLHK